MRTEVELLEEPHSYLVRGDPSPWPSVTQVIWPRGSGLSRVDPDYLEWRRAVGKEVHRLCHLIDHERDFLERFDVDAECEPYCRAYMSFLRTTGFQVVYSELIVTLDALRVAGTLDKFGFFPGSPTGIIIDLKTGACDPEVGLQLAGYAIGMHFQPVLRYALKLNRNGTYKLIQYDNDDDYECFRALVTYHNWRVNAYGGAKWTQ